MGGGDPLSDCLAAWLEAGGEWAEFWTLTPWQSVQVIDARRRQLTATAWQIAVFSGMAQAGKLKPLETYLSKRGPARQQSPEEIFRTADRLFSSHERRQK